MPLLLVELLAGRTDDQLREFTRVVTDAVVDILDAPPASVVVRFSEYPASRMGSGGVLAADRAAPPGQPESSAI
jgi:4-oxalocrotonate tautomerase family enzyme